MTCDVGSHSLSSHAPLRQSAGQGSSRRHGTQLFIALGIYHVPALVAELGT